jgi:hypothetical protein
MSIIKTEKQLDDYVEDKIKMFKEIKEKDYVEKTLASFKQENLPNPFDVVRDFIKEKGLKLYGGQALHEHLAKRNKPIYKEFEFPDYDVFSPDAWNHAKELCDRLYKLGFYFVEAKSSIVNDKKHQTYKVAVDLIYVLDLTQIGCTPENLKKDKCADCGMDNDSKCYSFFNNIPGNDILTNDPKEYRESYNYKKNTGNFKDKLLVCSPDWLKISMYLEMSQLVQDPTRLEKVFKRLTLFESEFEYARCSRNESDRKNLYLEQASDKLYSDDRVSEILKFTEKWSNQNNLINYGANAYNFYTKHKSVDQLPVINYETYCEKEPKKYFNDLTELLESQFKKYKLKVKVEPRIVYWKDIDSENYDLYFKLGNTKFVHLITFTKIVECMPYVKEKSTLFASFDRIKYVFYRGAVLRDIVDKSEPIPKDYVCLLQDLFDIEMDMRKQSKSLILTGKYMSFNDKCLGGGIGKLLDNLYYNFGKSIRMSKKIKIYYNTPTEDMITKIYPAEKDTLMASYRPAELKSKYYSKMVKFMDKMAKNPFREYKMSNTFSKTKSKTLVKSAYFSRKHKLIKSIKRKHTKLDSRSSPFFSFFNLFDRKGWSSINENPAQESREPVDRPRSIPKKKRRSKKKQKNYLRGAQKSIRNELQLKKQKEMDIAVINSMSRLS